ncbi:MAG: hypothetical protein EZS28_019441, partial [Streblomastix strix]
MSYIDNSESNIKKLTQQLQQGDAGAALKELTEITRTFDGRAYFVGENGLELLGQILRKSNDPNAPNTFAAAAVLINLLDLDDIIQVLIEKDFAAVLLEIVLASIKRPAVSISASLVLKKLAEEEPGRKMIVQSKGGIKPLLAIFDAFIAEGIKNPTGGLTILYQIVCSLISKICESDDLVPQFIQSGFVNKLQTVRRGHLVNARKSDESLKVLKASTLALYSFVKNEESADQFLPQTDMKTLRNLLSIAVAQDPQKDAVASRYPSNGTIAASIVSLLDKACVTYMSYDAEVVFIITSLIVHIGSFDASGSGSATSAQSLQTQQTLEAQQRLLEYFMVQDKSEVTQSILRNICVTIRLGCQTKEMIQNAVNLDLFPQILEICQIHTQINSEITETVLAFIHTITSISTQSGKGQDSPGVQEIKKRPGFSTAFVQIDDFFT